MAIVQMEGLGQLKSLMISSGIKSEISRFVTWCPTQKQLIFLTVSEKMGERDWQSKRPRCTGSKETDTPDDR
jgi:hypothetical protein